jgi:hypothetical protein
MPVVPDKYRGSREYALAYSALIAAAHSGAMVTYEGIARLTGLPERGSAMAKAVGRLVGEISEDEVLRRRPMLSALVVEKNTGLAGKGFFKLASDLQQFVGTSKSKTRDFLSKEKRKLYELWR